MSWITPTLSLNLKTNGQGILIREAARDMGECELSPLGFIAEAFLAHTTGYKGSTAKLQNSTSIASIYHIKDNFYACPVFVKFCG
jgi:hypothetical protein